MHYISLDCGLGISSMKDIMSQQEQEVDLHRLHFRSDNTNNSLRYKRKHEPMNVCIANLLLYLNLFFPFCHRLDFVKKKHIKSMNPFNLPARTTMHMPHTAKHATD